jgi:voltage-gated potassium channel
MKTPLERIRIGAVLLVAILSAAVFGYRWAGWSWLDAVYMVVTTVATVGYGEIGPMTPPLRLMTIFLIIFGITAGAYTMGGFIQMVTEGEIERALGERRLGREIAKLRSHVVICGFGRIGKILSAELQRLKMPFVIIECEPQRIREAHEQSYLALAGDATEESVLEMAGVPQAKTLVIALPNDAANVFITLTGRNMNRNLQIIARGEQLSTQKKLMQAGADRVVLPATIGAMRIANMLTRPSAVEFLELVAGKSTLDVEIDEMVVPAGSRLVAQTVAQAEARRKHGLLFVAVRRGDGQMIFNPDDDFCFQTDDTIIVMGKANDISRFRAEYRV